MPKKIYEALQEEKKGFHIGQRVILPFRCQIIKLIIDGEIYTEMVGGESIKISQDPKNTSIYFRTSGKLRNLVNTYKVIKMIVAEWEDDLVETDSHIKIVCEPEDNHVLAIYQPTDDMIFIE